MMITKLKIHNFLDNTINKADDKQNPGISPVELENLTGDIHNFISHIPVEKISRLEDNCEFACFIGNYLKDFDAVNRLRKSRQKTTSGSIEHKMNEVYELEDLITEYGTYIEKLITKYFPKLPVTISKEDLSQEVIARVLLKIDKFYFFSRFTTWLYRVIINTCYEKFRKKEVKQVYFSDLESDNFKVEIEDPSAHQHFLRIERNESYREFENALRKYIENFYEYSINKERNISIIEQLKNGKSRKEIALEMGINLNTLNSIINRFRKKADINDIFDETEEF